MYKIRSYVEQQGKRGEDALLVVEKENAIWFCLSDGAGGTGSGANASSYVIEAFKDLTNVDDFNDPEDFESFLRKVDLELSMNVEGGEATSIIGKIVNRTLVGASVGDSEAHIINQDFVFELTHLQYAKPLLGSGKSLPIGFGPLELTSPLIIGSDGLFKYVDYNLLKANVIKCEPVISDIVSLAKQSIGGLQDDISIILVNPK
ncbi:hypothetical protein [Aliikangiella sp. IMCC44359]|uniref:hypothetical protein n=1 Tax=Aliikangiella sp. IMCC44359 TaxID=3459125 RepID=UPI00403AFADE